MARQVELRRHTDNDGDALTADGVRAAVDLGMRLEGSYDVLVSTGAQRATQTLACLLAGLGERVPGGTVVEPGLRSQVEDRWRAAAKQAGSSDLNAIRSVDPDLVEQEAATLGAALRRVFELLPVGGRALVVGHSPTNEAAVLGLTGQVVRPLGKGAGVLLSAGEDGVDVAPLPG